MQSDGVRVGIVVEEAVDQCREARPEFDHLVVRHERPT
jgi:hypothetical protein